MGRIGDFGWAIRERLSGAAVAVVLALAGLGAGVAALAIALDAKDEAEQAVSTAPAPASVPTTTSGDSEVTARVDELNERVAAIEESVSQLRTETSDAAAAEPSETTTGKEPTIPEPPQLPEGIEVPGVDVPGAGAPAKP